MQKPGTHVLLAIARIRKDCDKVEAFIRNRRAGIAKKMVASRRKNKRNGSKLQKIGRMMLRKKGVSNSEACRRVGWDTVSLPTVARKCGIRYSVKRVNGENRYIGKE